MTNRGRRPVPTLRYGATIVPSPAAEQLKHQMIFEVLGGHVVIPRLPLDPDGRQRTADGTRLLTLPQTAHRLGVAERDLVDSYTIFVREVGLGLAELQHAIERRQQLGDSSSDRSNTMNETTNEKVKCLVRPGMTISNSASNKMNDQNGIVRAVLQVGCSYEAEDGTRHFAKWADVVVDDCAPDPAFICD